MAFNDIGISSLPEEVLITIFKFLNIRNKLTASLVCKEWLRAINCHELLCDIKVQFSTELPDAFKRSRMTRRFEWFSFTSLSINYSVVQFLKKYSKQFVKLRFCDCKKKNKREMKYKSKSKDQASFLNCDNLKHLEIEYSDVIALFAFLPNLTTLIIYYDSGLTDYLVSQLNKTVLKLEIFSLHAYGVYNMTDYEQYYMNGKTVETDPSKSILSFISIKKIIEKNRYSLKHLNITRLYLPPENVITISAIKGLKLKSVFFPWDFTSSFIEKFCENQFSLTQLQLDGFTCVTDDTIHALCKCLPNLESLHLKHNCVIDESIIQIFQLEQLQVLDLHRCLRISEFNYQQAVLKLKAFKLKELNLAAARIDDASLCELLKHNLNICHLVLSSTSVSNKTLNMICTNLINLESLELESCCGISDPGITGDFEDYSDSLTPTPLSNLKNLRKLVISDNNLITANGCIRAVRFPKLRYLHLGYFDDSIFHEFLMTVFLKHNPLLYKLIIRSHSKTYFKGGVL